LGEYEQGLGTAQRAVKLNPESALAYSRLASMYVYLSKTGGSTTPQK
jgi:hypothetical protein